MTGTEIARKCSGAVFYLKTYYDTDCKTQYGSASGFFISADGTAVTNYHAIKDHYGAKATLVSGETYPVLGVISADPDRDLAVIKIGMTAESGNSITKFPYLKLGRSALAEEGTPCMPSAHPKPVEYHDFGYHQQFMACCGFQSSISPGLDSHRGGQQRGCALE